MSDVLPRILCSDTNAYRDYGILSLHVPLGSARDVLLYRIVYTIGINGRSKSLYGGNGEGVMLVNIYRYIEGDESPLLVLLFFTDDGARTQ